MLNVRKLAAIDLHFLGTKFILAEFGIGVVGAIAVGIISVAQGIHRFHSVWIVLFGVYLMLIGANYFPLLLHAIDLARRGSVQREIADDLQDKQMAFRKYRRQSFLLLVPFVVPILAIVQYHGRSDDQGAE